MNYSVLHEKIAKQEVYIVFLLFVVSTFIRFFIANRFPLSIQCYPDELRYYHIASSMANGTGISIYNASTDFQKILYSLFLIPACMFSDIDTRFSLVFLTNSILMSLGVFFVFYLSKHLIHSMVYRIIVCLMYLLSGYMTYTMTFISENLWIPLSLGILCVFYKLFQHQEINDKKSTLIFNLLAGLLSYAAYLCKEIALVFLVSYAIYHLIWIAVEKYWNKNIQYGNHINQILVFSMGFIVPFLLVKVTLFTGLGNSYHQQSLDALRGEDKIYYLCYGVIYFITSILIMSYVLPSFVPMFNFSKLNCRVKKFYVFIWILLLVTAIVVAYTITIREDYPSLVPRVHTRYIAWIPILFFIIFVHSIEQNFNKVMCNCYKIYIFISITIFMPLLYRGIGSGSNIDNTSFVFSNMSLNSIFFITCFIFIFSSMSIYFLESRRKIVCAIFTIFIVFTQIYDNYHGIKLQNNQYKIQIEEHNEAIAIQKFIAANRNDNFLLFENFLSKDSKILDTYLTDKNIYMSSFKKINTSNDIVLEDINIPVIWGDTYKKQKIDYIILKKPSSAVESSNCVKIENDSISRYALYRILDSSRPISFFESYLDKDEKIIFVGSLWNADKYIEKGISNNENKFTWSVGNEIVFKRIKIGKEKNTTKYKMNILLDSIYTEKQDIVITCNNIAIYKNTIDNKIKNIVLPVSTDENGYLNLRILLPDAISPKSRNGSEDNRILAIALKNISFHELK